MSIDKLRKMLEESNNVVFFGGAGVSTESNIPDFRSSTGIYNQNIGDYPPEYLFSRDFFYEDTEGFFDNYRLRRYDILGDVEPNKAHLALAELERIGKVKAVITQNIDGLHQKAGSKNVYELHGSIYRSYCMDCGVFHSMEYMRDSTGIPKCKECGGLVKPDVVLFGEGLDMDVVENAIKYVSRADMFIIGGTSLVVNPAASLVRYYKGNKLVIINKDSTPYDNEANLVFNESIGKVLNSLI